LRLQKGRKICNRGRGRNCPHTGGSRGGKLYHRDIGSSLRGVLRRKEVHRRGGGGTWVSYPLGGGWSFKTKWGKKKNSFSRGEVDILKNKKKIRVKKRPLVVITDEKKKAVPRKGKKAPAQKREGPLAPG